MFVALVFADAWAAKPRPEVGRVDRVQGNVQAFYADQVRSLGEGAAVYLDDRLSTDEGARLLVRLADETELTLGENADLVVDSFVYDPGAGKGGLLLDSLKGAFLFVGGLVEDQSGADVRIKTPVATLGIRGTTAWGGPIDGQFGVLVLDGVVTVSNGAGEVTLTQGMGTSLRRAADAPGEPKRWPDEKVSRAIATVSFPD
ncbi:MAG: FecR domain-containing protein [Alphaproteobacteria bacterium]